MTSEGTNYSITWKTDFAVVTEVVNLEMDGR